MDTQAMQGQAQMRGYVGGELKTASVEADSVVGKALENLKSEINGLSVTAEVLVSRLGVVSRPSPIGNASDSAKSNPTPCSSSLTTKRIDDQAGRVRMLTMQLQSAIDGLEI